MCGWQNSQPATPSGYMSTERNNRRHRRRSTCNNKILKLINLCTSKLHYSFGSNEETSCERHLWSGRMRWMHFVCSASSTRESISSTATATRMTRHGASTNEQTCGQTSTTMHEITLLLRTNNNHNAHQQPSHTHRIYWALIFVHASRFRTHTHINIKWSIVS